MNKEHNTKALPALIARIRSERTALLAAPAVVLDLRGNGGGSSDWSRQMAVALWGEDAPAWAEPKARIEVDWRAPIQSLSLSRLEPLGDQAVGIALTCLSSWGRGMRELADPGDLRIMVRDEVWKQMRLGLEAVKSLDADMRFSRRDGEIQFVVGHKPGDMLTVGESTSAATATARPARSASRRGRGGRGRRR